MAIPKSCTLRLCLFCFSFFFLFVFFIPFNHFSILNQYQIFLFNSNNLYTVVWFSVTIPIESFVFTLLYYIQISLFNINNLRTVIGFKVVVVNNNNNKKKKTTCKIVDFAVPADRRVKLKESEKKDKYLDLVREL